MKPVILAGGFGSRLSEATNLIHKPMVEIGGKPILWHIMKIYSDYGINEFVICCGYKQYVIKEYFANYFRHNWDMTVDLSNNTVTIHDNHSEDWKVTMVDTGLNTMTGGRVKRIQLIIPEHQMRNIRLLSNLLMNNMNSLSTQISSLYDVTHRLLYRGADGQPIYSDSFTRLNGEVLRQSDALFGFRGATDEEEASLCLALLMGYNATIYNNGDKEQRIQTVLNHCWVVLDRLPASLLKVCLLTYCYGEVFDEELAREAHSIIDSWSDREFTEEEKEIVGLLGDIEENPYPNSEVE